MQTVGHVPPPPSGGDRQLSPDYEVFGLAGRSEVPRLERWAFTGADLRMVALSWGHRFDLAQEWCEVTSFRPAPAAGEQSPGQQLETIVRPGERVRFEVEELRVRGHIAGETPESALALSESRVSVDGIESVVDVVSSGIVSSTKLSSATGVLVLITWHGAPGWRVPPLHALPSPLVYEPVGE